MYCVVVVTVLLLCRVHNSTLEKDTTMKDVSRCTHLDMTIELMSAFVLRIHHGPLLQWQLYVIVYNRYSEHTSYVVLIV